MCLMQTVPVAQRPQNAGLGKWYKACQEPLPTSLMTWAVWLLCAWFQGWEVGFLRLPWCIGVKTGGLVPPVQSRCLHAVDTWQMGVSMVDD
jgi:hypothetical protein